MFVTPSQISAHILVYSTHSKLPLAVDGVFRDAVLFGELRRRLALSYAFNDLLLYVRIDAVSGFGHRDPSYQIGGPRSIQLALKLVFYSNSHVMSRPFYGEPIPENKSQLNSACQSQAADSICQPCPSSDPRS
jgi:hypothetical protein